MDYTREGLEAVLKQKQDIQLTPHFRLKEMIKTSRSSIDNWPKDVDTVLALRYNCIWILEKVRDHFGKAVTVNSGYRSPELNKAIGGSTTSQHMKGEAVDFEINGVANADICRWIKANLIFDQLILEFYTQGSPNSGWVHCSVKPTQNRSQTLTARRENGKTVYLPGLQL